MNHYFRFVKKKIIFQFIWLLVLWKVDGKHSQGTESVRNFIDSLVMSESTSSPIAFTAFQMYDGLSCNDYEALESTYQQIIADTVVSALDNAVNSSDVHFISYSAVNRLRSRKLTMHQKDNSVETFESVGDDEGDGAQWCTFTYTVGYTADFTYDLLSGELINAVDDGVFNNIFHYVASEYGLDADNITSPWVSTDDYALTLSPTSSPSDQPTLPPTPGVLTQEPSAYPTLYPTLAVPSDEPTHEPSSIPTAPTLQPTPATPSFTALEKFDGLSCEAYESLESTYQQIIAGTVVSVLDDAINTSDVTFVSYSSVQRVRSRKLKGPKDSGADSIASHHKDSSFHNTPGHYKTTGDTSDTTNSFEDGTTDDEDSTGDYCIVTYTVTYTSDTTYALLSGELIDSVDDGLFNTILHYAASQFDIDVNNVTSPWVITYDYAVTSSPTPASYTPYPTPNGNTIAPTPTSGTQFPTLLATSAPSEESTTPEPSPSIAAYTAGPTFTQNIFFGDQIVYGITYSDYLANSDAVQTTMAEAIVSVMTWEVLPSKYVEYLGVTVYGESYAGGSYGIQVTYSVNYDSEDDYQALSTELTTAVQDGTFTTELQKLAVDNNVPVLYNAASTSVLVFEFTKSPTFEPSAPPSLMPTSQIPTEFPTFSPTDEPTSDPTSEPTLQPTQPTITPTYLPGSPTPQPTITPTLSPTASPTYLPGAPTPVPTYVAGAPTPVPTYLPDSPTPEPTFLPTTSSPTYLPGAPTPAPSAPTAEPTSGPTTPTEPPTADPTYQPTHKPTLSPTPKPSHIPTDQPTHKPTKIPTAIPTSLPTDLPTLTPTQPPTEEPTDYPTAQPTYKPMFILIANQVLEGISEIDFEDAPNTTVAFIESVYSVLNEQIQLADIAVEEVFPYTGSRRLQTISQGELGAMQEQDSSSAMNVIYWVTFYDKDQYTTLYDQIKESVLNGNFTAVLQENAVKYDVSVLEGVTTSSVSMYEFTWSPTPGPTSADKPTPKPTNTPTPRPTDFVSFTIAATQTLSGIDITDYKGNESNINNVFTETVASTFGNGVEAEDVTITNVTEIFTLAKPFGVDLSPTLHVDYNIFVDHLDGFQDNQAGFDAVAANYTEAVADGTFTSNLQAIAADEGVTSLANVNSQNATLKLLSSTTTPTAAPTLILITKQDGYIIMATVLLIVAVCILACVIGYYCSSSSSSDYEPTLRQTPGLEEARSQSYGATDGGQV